MEEAIAYFEQWFMWNNHEDRHTGLNLHTLASVYYGTIDEVVRERQKVMDLAWMTNPLRFAKGHPIVKFNPPVVGINLHLNAENLIDKSLEYGVVS